MDSERIPPFPSDRNDASSGSGGPNPSDQVGSQAWDALERQLKAELSPALELIRPLGWGERAGVYLAREAALKRLVAVKVLSPEISRDATSRLRFEREGQAIASIFHPNVIAIFRVDRLSNEVPFLVMQYVKGRSLADQLESEGRMGVAEVRRIIADLAAALAAAHKKGIVHREVKPANVMIEEDSGRAILTDFGLAAILSSGDEKPMGLTRTGEVIGDMAYMSPEQMTGRSLTELADIYSLGVMGYELLTLRKPFDRSSETAGATTAAALPRISQLRADVDPVLEAIVHRCLSTNPSHRPSAADIVRQLTAPAHQTTQPIAVPSPASSQAESTVRREPVEPRSGIARFIAELKRRRVARVTGVYIVAAVAVVGAADNFFPALRLPDWTVTLVAALALLGLPITVGLAWAFDITSEGVVRTKTAEHSATD